MIRYKLPLVKKKTLCYHMSPMDISIISEESIKVRGKAGSFIIDPSDSMPKTNADGILFQNPQSRAGISRVLDSRIIVCGPGDYEVSGIKVMGLKGKENLLYRIIVDGVVVLLAKSSEITNDDKINSCDILLLNVDSDFAESLVATVDPKVAILYGKSLKEALKLLGKEILAPVKKFATTKDKLPVEMEVVALG